MSGVGLGGEVSVSEIKGRIGEAGTDGAVTADRLVSASEAVEWVETVELVEGARKRLGTSGDDDGARKSGILPDNGLQGLTITESPVQCEILT